MPPQGGGVGKGEGAMNTEEMTEHALARAAAGELDCAQAVRLIAIGIEAACLTIGGDARPDDPLWAPWARQVCPPTLVGDPKVEEVLRGLEAHLGAPEGWAADFAEKTAGAAGAAAMQ